MLPLTKHSSTDMQGEERGSERLHFLDNLRVFLTCLVVFHHIPGWYYKEPVQDAATLAVIGVFMILNQTFFMGLFFFISACFIPSSYDRKGAGLFLRDRLLRLGIPLVVYGLLIGPLTNYIGDGLPQPFQLFFSKYLLPWRALNGPLWFVGVLLVFSTGYVVWRKLRGQHSLIVPKTHSFPSLFSLALCVLVLAALTGLIRSIPLDGLGWLDGLFPYYEIRYAAQYITLFLAGLIAYHYNWMATLPQTVRSGLFCLLGSFILLLPIIFYGGENAMAYVMDGGWHWQTFNYALWEAVFGITMCITLLALFRKRLNRANRFTMWLAGNAYAVYILHPLILALLWFTLKGLPIHPLLTFLLIGITGLPLCFGCGYLLRKLPFARKIL
ncbi:acyltransferase family protein [Ktedonobacter racemifer]|uniref:Acyltransferase 3 n=1 Tax=Ktedonobacter racemifer DSM 44963 TaxID=485913 RepID=D6TYM3_KTERA|nr:acyltransferase family protein [Ktedonobacter racemifer]EFH85098.1 acyltransferase 3 [Ktedonobacter racemifer DSM 44963]